MFNIMKRPINIYNNHDSVLIFLSYQCRRTQIASRQEAHEEDVDQRIFVGLVHVATEVRALDLVDNTGGRRRKAPPVFRFGQHGRNIETGQ